jgi:hypothetical protein
MKIPVFVSCPTMLAKKQENARRIIIANLLALGLEPRAVGRTDYPDMFPLKEVVVLARHCSGGVILGFEQFATKSGIWKRGTKEEDRIREKIGFPSPWNHIEAGILFSLGIPLIIFREDAIKGGVFDNGVTDVFIHRMPMGKLSPTEKDSLKQVLLSWQGKVRNHYYSFNGSE